MDHGLQRIKLDFVPKFITRLAPQKTKSCHQYHASYESGGILKFSLIHNKQRGNRE